MTTDFRSRCVTTALLLGLCALLAGCVVSESRPIERISAAKATTEVPEDQLLDVGIGLFDPNVPESTEQQEAQRVYPEVRKAESRYIPTMLRDTLEGTGHWGQVRVLPAGDEGMDVMISGRILESDGRHLKLAVIVVDASGRPWFDRVYEAVADTRAYKDTVARPRDPYDNLYNTIANDLLAARALLSDAQRAQLRKVSDLRFAAAVAPYAYGSHLAKDRKGQYTVARLPAESDPVYQRMGRIRERDYAFVDTLNEHYANFSETMADSYTNWRRYSHESLEAESQAKREALTRQVLGAAAIIGGVVAGSNSNSSAASAASTAAVLGGVYAFKSGLDKRAEIKMHSDSIRQLGDSFQAEISPLVVDVEGRTLQLKGSAEEQFTEWRRLLRELYESETGVPVSGAPVAPAATSGGGRT